MFNRVQRGNNETNYVISQEINSAFYLKDRKKFFEIINAVGISTVGVGEGVQGRGLAPTLHVAKQQ